MTTQEAQQEIKRLTALVQHHNVLYHQKGQPEISDYAFDQLLARLAALENQFPTFRLKDSPTQVVGEMHTADRCIAVVALQCSHDRNSRCLNNNAP